MSIEIRENVPLTPLTSFKIGGPARFFTEVSSEEEILEAVNYAGENGLEIFVMAGGSNILVSDDGFSGLVIKIKNVTCEVQDFSLTCEAGLSLSEAVSKARENSLSGLEWAAGIPGSVGGAVRGNVGAYGSEIKDSITSVKALEIPDLLNKITNSKLQIPNKFQNPKLKNLTNKESRFSYRSSIFKENKNLIVLSCVLKLQKGEKGEIEEKMREVIRKRSEKIPKEPSPGSFFQNPETDNEELIRKFEIDTGKKVTDHVSAYQYSGNKIKIPASWLIEEAGLKGKKMGGVMVSEKHANFVVNLGTGKAQDVIMLASLIKMKIRDEFGIQLKEEVQLVGF